MNSVTTTLKVIPVLKVYVWFMNMGPGAQSVFPSMVWGGGGGINVGAGVKDMPYTNKKKPLNSCVDGVFFVG